MVESFVQIWRVDVDLFRLNVCSNNNHNNRTGPPECHSEAFYETNFVILFIKFCITILVFFVTDFGKGNGTIPF